MRELLLLFVIVIKGFVAHADGPCTPKQAHLSLGDIYYSNYIGDDGHVRRTQKQAMGIGNDVAKIVWVTLEACNDSYVSVQRTNFSSKPQKFIPRAEYYSQYINTTSLGNHTEGQYTRYAQIVELSDLAPDTLYTALLNSRDGSISFNFKIPHLYQPEKALKILFYADTDYSNVSQPTISRLQSYFCNDSNEFNLTIFAGDLAYEIVSDAGQKGDQFFEYFQPFWTTRPVMITAGNHEYFYNFSLLNYRVKMPLYNQTSNHYYSWNVGYAHFLSMNYDFYEAADNVTQLQMYQWVERDLMTANLTENRKKTPWIIVYTHQPIYCSQRFPGSGELASCQYFYAKRKIWDELVSKYKVDLYLSGHIHNYERMGAVYNNKSWPYQNFTDSNGVEVISNPSAPIHVVDGSSGDTVYMAQEPYPRLNYSLMVDVNVGLSILTIYNSSVIGWEHIKSDDGSVIDQFYIKRDRLVASEGNFDPIITGLFLLLVAAVLYAEFKKKKSKASNSGLTEPFRNDLIEPIRRKQLETQLHDLRSNQTNDPFKKKESI